MEKKMAIQLRNVTKSFKDEKILKNITHEFEAGQIHGIVGMNGSGKTVLLKCICGFLSVDEGEILVEGKRIGKEIDFPPSVGLIIENPGFLPELSAYRNLKLLGTLSQKADDEQIRSAIKKVGLDPDSKKKVGKYSLGMRERLGIAQAIMENPRILILDEPFNGLDKKGVKEICDLILEEKQNGTTILLISHSAVDMESLCDTVCEMELGVMRKAAHRASV